MNNTALAVSFNVGALVLNPQNRGIPTKDSGTLHETRGLLIRFLQQCRPPPLLSFLSPEVSADAPGLAAQAGSAQDQIKPPKPPPIPRGVATTSGPSGRLLGLSLQLRPHGPFGAVCLRLSQNKKPGGRMSNLSWTATCFGSLASCGHPRR